jgi:hypothetical protein
MKHYSKEELDQYVHKDVNFLLKRRIKSHLHGCSKCSKVLEELIEDDRLLNDIRSSVRDSTTESNSDKTYSNLSSIFGSGRKDSSIA